MIHMKLDVISDIVRIKFHNKSILFNVKEFEMYVDGNKINLNRNVRTYNKELQKEITTKYVQNKKTLFQFKIHNQVLIIDLINDHKIYFRFWKSTILFNKWREPETEIILINVDFRNEVVYLFHNDLNNHAHFWDMTKQEQQQLTMM